MDTTVSFRLEGEGNGTRVHFEHAGFDAFGPAGAGAYQGAEYGWTRMLGALETAIAALAPARASGR